MSQAENTQRRGIFISLRIKLLLLFIILFTAGFAAAFYWFYTFATDIAVSNLRRDLEATALAASVGIDGDVHERLYKTGHIDDEDYLAINRFLRSILATSPKAAGVYTYVQEPDEPNQVRFVVSSVIPPGEQAEDLFSRHHRARVRRSPPADVQERVGQMLRHIGPAAERCVDRPRETERQVGGRAPHQPETRDRAPVVGADGVEVGGLRQPAEKPAALDRPDGRRERASGAHEQARDAGRVAAEDDRVADPRPPPLVLGRESRDERSQARPERCLAGIDRRQPAVAESQRDVNGRREVPG